LVALGVALLVFIASAGADELPLHQRIDQYTAAASLGPVAPPAGDAEFLRRIYLDLVGTIPDTATARAFLADTSADKRAALVDRLLADPRFARHMATTFDVMLMERRRQRALPGREWTVSDEDWREYLRQSFANNKPLDQLAREILAADGVDPALRPAVKFYLDRDGDPDLLARDVGRLFFGRDLQCAQCHDHPLVADYLQADYYGLKAFVNRGVLFDDAKEKKVYYAEDAVGEVTFKSVFTGEGREYVLPKLPQAPPVAEPLLAKADAYVVAPAKDTRPIPKYSRRAQLAALATDGSNDAFNRNLANRLWATMTGRGVIHPLDMVHSDNPAVESKLLALLSDELVKMKFDTRAFLREIALSQTYQRASVMPTPADLPVDATAAAATMTTWKAQADKLAAALPELEAAAKSTAAAFDAAYEKYAAAAKAREAVDKAHAEAKKASDDVSAALAAAVKDAAAKDDVLKALVEARVKADAAVAKLPDDKPLAEAAAQFKNRANEVDTQLAELRKQINEKQPQVQAASLKLAEADKALAQTTADVTVGRAALDTAEVAAREARLKFRGSQSEAKELAARITAGQAVLDYLALQSAAAASQAATLAANQRYAELKSQQSIAPAELLAAEEAGLAAAEKAAEDEMALGVSWKSLADNATIRFLVAPLRPLSPEQLSWATMQAVGIVDKQSAALADEAKKELEAKTDMPPEQKAAEQARLVDGRLAEKLRGNVSRFVSLFGQEPGQPATFQSTVHQALFLTNAGLLVDWLKPAADNLSERLTKAQQPADVANELYLGVLSRLPSDDEQALVTEYWQATEQDRAAAASEMVWGLLTSGEFRFNH
jgi:hypothetical protein